MAHYFQLLGSDTPNGYGGCCYYGPLDHPAFHESPETSAPAGHALRLTLQPEHGECRHDVHSCAETDLTTSPGIHGDVHNLALPASHPPGDGEESSGTAAATSTPATWNWSSYLQAPRPTWPTAGPLYRSSLLHPPPFLSASSTAAAPPPLTADTGSSGSEGYIFFNCPEGAQRFSSEANIKLKKVRCFCFTRWGCAGTAGTAVGAASAVMGLPGMLFTINDAGSRQATFFGPSAGVSQPDSSAYSSTAAAAAAAVGPTSSEGLRGFLSALRFHYFQYRPMIFRQLHGAVACCGATGHMAKATAAVATAQTTPVVNEVHFTEIADVATDAEPFFYTTVPLSGQSVLVSFRISGSCGSDAERRQHRTRGIATDARNSDGDGQTNSQYHHHSSESTTEPDARYQVHDSSKLVLGYAIVVAPGAAFDAGKARVLGVRSGPKYGQLKQGIAVEADGDDDASAGSKASKKKKGGGGKTGQESVSDATEATPPVDSAAVARRVVHPFEVMRPTTATRHAYVSLVLDGDAPADVQRALTHLLGDASPPAPEAAVRGSVGKRNREGGALLALLRSAFPHLAYYYQDAEEVQATAPVGQLPRANFVQRPRQLVVRHVTHVQPASYFVDFHRSCAGMRNEFAELAGSVGAMGALPSTTAAATPDARVYAAYNAFVFANIASHDGTNAGPSSAELHQAAQVSLQPSLSFTLADIAEVEERVEERSGDGGGGGVDGVIADSKVDMAVTSVRTWHLFTSHVQRHFTAFPTALVHRYHLNHLASTLFPLYGMTKAIDTDSGGGGLQLSAETPVTYWPYSLKLRCVPETALQFQRKGQPTKLPTNAAATITTTAAVFAASARKRERGDEEREEEKKGVHPSTAARSVPFSTTPAKPQTAAPPMHLSVVDGRASLLPYPTRASALSLLSPDFLASVAGSRVVHGITPLLEEASGAERKREEREETGDGPTSSVAATGERGVGALGFLGTGSAVPSKYRNVSGTYLELFLPGCCFGGGSAEDEVVGVAAGEKSSADGAKLRRGVVILDFGEGSIGQLASLCEGVREGHAASRHHPGNIASATTSGVTAPTLASTSTPAPGEPTEDPLRRFVLDVVLVFISHAHADHHLGLLSLLTLRHYYLTQRPTTTTTTTTTTPITKLLVVCPAEVYQFVMDAWGKTPPYAEWLHEECCFAQMPPPVRALARSDAAVAPVEALDSPGSESVGEGSASTATLHRRDSSIQQRVVPVPRLESLLHEWNRNIARHDTAPRGVHADVLDEEGWWAAEVITVDHPANAHALLLRFPFRSHTPTTRDARGEAAGAVPDTSRVFLFSGDTRPSSFLVERSHAFAARRRCNAASHHTTAAAASPPPVFILLHEATFGPGFEGEAVRKKHSTLPEALGIGAAVGAEFVVLNHFSQRYPKLPGLAEEQLGGRSTGLVCQRRPRGTATSSPELGNEEEEMGESERGAARTDDQDNGGQRENEGGSDTAVSPYANMSFAFDLMSVSFTDMQRGVVPRLTPALVRLLEEYDSWGVSTTHRMRTSKPGEGGGAEKGKRAFTKPQLEE